MDARSAIGKMEMPKEITGAKRQQAIASIAAAPKNLREAVRGLNDAQLDTPYREGGWTARQGVQHGPGSTMDAYARAMGQGVAFAEGGRFFAQAGASGAW